MHACIFWIMPSRVCIRQKVYLWERLGTYSHFLLLWFRVLFWAWSISSPLIFHWKSNINKKRAKPREKSRRVIIIGECFWGGGFDLLCIPFFFKPMPMSCKMKKHWEAFFHFLTKTCTKKHFFDYQLFPKRIYFFGSCLLLFLPLV